MLYSESYSVLIKSPKMAANGWSRMKLSTPLRLSIYLAVIAPPPCQYVLTLPGYNYDPTSKKNNNIRDYPPAVDTHPLAHRLKRTNMSNTKQKRGSVKPVFK